MGRFGPDPYLFFNTVYRDTAPWDIGRAQPDMAALLADYPPLTPVLDIGCGTGDLAIHIAQRGLTVVGVDFIGSAVEQARVKAAALPPEVASLLEFQVADASQPSRLGTLFGSAVDSGFLHLLTPEESGRFLDDLANVLLPGGRYYLHEFAVEFAIENAPRQVTETELRARFTANKGWRILDIRPAEFHSRVAAPVAAIAACVERL